MQLLCALRDAIAGHMELCKKGLLHRDVSPYNVLFGSPGAGPGDRGILIDFDIALRRNWKEPADGQIRTRLYQSVADISSWTVPDPLPHDHLDDLESFLYILVQIVFTTDSNGIPYSGSDMISRWEQTGNRRTAAIEKEAYLASQFLPKVVTENWPSPCVDLVVAMTKFIHPIMGEKMRLDQLSPRARNGKDKVFAANAIQHYAHVLQIFDVAIEALEKPDTWKGSEPDAPCADSPSSSSASSDSSVERFMEEYRRLHPPESSSQSPDRPLVASNFWESSSSSSKRVSDVIMPEDTLFDTLNRVLIMVTSG
ncbi:hypothetical protein MD484_g6098, partial [Candolleomyces efflorescens]